MSRRKQLEELQRTLQSSLTGNQPQPPEAPANAQPEAEESSVGPQFGRRKDPRRYAQINVNISRDLKARVKAELIRESRTMQELIEFLLEQYIDGKIN